MGFSAKQLAALHRNLDDRHIRTRETSGRGLSYIEAWHAIAEANRIFGFDGWNRETAETRCVLARENRGTFLAVYVAKVRITVQADGSTVIRDGHGTGEGHGISAGEVHDLALKAAETDATKRALATFGKPFGLDLYRDSKRKADRNVAGLVPATPRVGFHPDDTTPIPRPSTYYGRRQRPIRAAAQNAHHRQPDKQTDEQRHRPPGPDKQGTVPHEASLVPAEPTSTRIDKSVFTLGEPKRIRDKGHLRFVASQPCLVCGRQPSDPHHLQFAQPRTLGMKVSDEFTVPLCRTHHRQLHDTGNEVAWWEDLDIDALAVAKGLWDEWRGRNQTVNSGASKPNLEMNLPPSGDNPR
ncbi:MAG: hypothetical protein GHHEDOFH_03581 [Pseudorhodoplanes sp.]|nr:hypothetical protein [Pseudorhodoplanes sp.]